MASTSTPASPYQTCRGATEKKTRSRPCHFPFKLEGAAGVSTLKRQGEPTLSWRGFQETLAKVADSSAIAGGTAPKISRTTSSLKPRSVNRDRLFRAYESMLPLNSLTRSSRYGGYTSEAQHSFVSAYEASGAIAWVKKVRHWRRWLAAAGSTPGKRPAGLASA